MYDMREKEVILSAFPENDYNWKKIVITTNKVWEALEVLSKGDKHSMTVKLQNWVCLFQEDKILEDELVRTCVGRIFQIVVGIKGCGGKKDDDKIIWKILKTLTPPFKQVAMMISQVIPCTDKFSKERLLARFEEEKVSLSQSGDLPRIETAFQHIEH